MPAGRDGAEAGPWWYIPADLSSGGILMSIIRLAAVLVCAGAVLAPVGAAVEEETGAATEVPEAPGAAERAALQKVDFLVGDWEGEGWSVGPSGERRRFWVREIYRFRGDDELLDMEGSFGAILPDGTRGPRREYGLGILYYDREADEYRMWHATNGAEIFTTAMNVDPATREMHYMKEYPEGLTGRFHLVVGTDGVWVSRFDILQPDGAWLQVMEFRMQRTAPSTASSQP